MRFARWVFLLAGTLGTLMVLFGAPILRGQFRKSMDRVAGGS